VFSSSTNAKIPNSNNRQIKRVILNPVSKKKFRILVIKPYKMENGNSNFRSKFISRVEYFILKLICLFVNLFSRKSRFKINKPPNENQRNNYYTGTNGTSPMPKTLTMWVYWLEIKNQIRQVF
jgi:hypothetical protein